MTRIARLAAVAATALLTISACSKPVPTSTDTPAATPVDTSITAEETKALTAIKESIKEFQDFKSDDKRLIRNKLKALLAELKTARGTFTSKGGKTAFSEVNNAFLISQLEKEDQLYWVAQYDKLAFGTPGQKLPVMKAVDAWKTKHPQQ